MAGGDIPGYLRWMFCGINIAIPTRGMGKEFIHMGFMSDSTSPVLGRELLFVEVAVAFLHFSAEIPHGICPARFFFSSMADVVQDRGVRYLLT